MQVSYFVLAEDVHGSEIKHCHLFSFSKGHSQLSDKAMPPVVGGC